MPDVKLSQLAATSPASAAAGAGLWTMAGHILGLRMEYVGPASVRVSSGSAWIPSLQRAVEVPVALTLSSLTLAASTWYHLYLYLNGATPAIEAVVAAPAAAYSGTARGKTGDASRRYIGSFKTGASSQILRFSHAPSSGLVTYSQGAQNAILAAGSATVSTVVSASPFCPTTAVSVLARVVSASSAVGVYLSDGSTVVDGTTTTYFTALNGGQTYTGPIPLDGSQQIAYANSDSGGAAYIQAVGYSYER